MKKLCLLSLYLILGSVGFAQIQKLPDIKVVGDSPVRAYLYKKNLPFNPDSKPDSLPAFVLRGLPPRQEAQILPLYRYPDHYLHLEGDTRFGLNGRYRLHPRSKVLNTLEAGISLKAPVGDLISTNYHLGADLVSESGDLLRGGIDYQNRDGRGLHNEYTGAEASLYSGDVMVSGTLFYDVTTQLGGYRIWQKNSSQRFDQSGLSFYHQNSLELGAQILENRLYIAMSKLGLHSRISLPLPYLDVAELHLMVDKRHVIPNLGFRWSYIPDFDQRITISNAPALEFQDYYELLRQYRWVDIRPGHTAKQPLNLSLAYEALFPLSREFQLRSIKAENTSRYTLQQVNLQSGVNPLIPRVEYTDVAFNRTQISATFGEGEFQFRQSIFAQLTYLTRYNWIRAGYQPVFGLETEALYSFEAWDTGLTLQQHYFSRDHLGRDLPEVVDLSLHAEYHIAKTSSVYLYANNLLNRRRWVFRTLPAEGICLYIGAKHRF